MKTLFVRVNNRIGSEYASCAAPDAQPPYHCLFSNPLGDIERVYLGIYRVQTHHRVRPNLARPVVDRCGHHHFLVDGSLASQERDDLVGPLWQIHSTKIQVTVLERGVVSYIKSLFRNVPAVFHWA